jgi:mannose-6-phosphate isomerase-like protein (cupin superfamily)
MSFTSRMLPAAPDAVAPDGSQVRVLTATGRGSMAHFTLPSGAVAHAVAHRTVDEVWFFLSGEGRMWRRLGEQEETLAVSPGMSLTLPVGTQFQFRCDGDAPLVAVGVTMPPWSNADEAYPVDGPWPATV